MNAREFLAQPDLTLEKLQELRIVDRNDCIAVIEFVHKEWDKIAAVFDNAFDALEKQDKEATGVQQCHN